MSRERLKIAAVSYINTYPFIYGIERSGVLKNYILETYSPAVCAEKLISGKVDIALAPVAILPGLPYYSIITDYCIGCNGPVKSVMLFSDVPMQKIKSVHLDFNSKTSVMLAKVLSRKLWNISPKFMNAGKDYEIEINGNAAGVVIGDRCFEMHQRFKYQFDLGEEWKKLTGLPFVFACWVTSKKLPAKTLAEFNEAIVYGMKKKEEFVNELAFEPVNGIEIGEYLSKNISYELDYLKKQALDLFLSDVYSLSLT